MEPAWGLFGRWVTPQRIHHHTQDALQRGIGWCDDIYQSLNAFLSRLHAYTGHHSVRCLRDTLLNSRKSVFRIYDAWRTYFYGHLQRLQELFDALLPKDFDLFERQVAWTLLIGTMVGILTSCAWFLSRNSSTKKLDSRNSSSASVTNAGVSDDASVTDPSLLKKHSTFVSYTITSPIDGKSITYPSIRTFYHPHPQAAKLPASPTALPLLVFIHGLGGSAAQFHPLLTSLVNVGSCLAIDLPGCGRSGFEPQNWEAYKIENLVALLAVAIEKHRDEALEQGVVLIGHSMGCFLSVLLASTSSSVKLRLSRHVLSVIAICPSAKAPSKKEVTAFRRLLSIPGPVFDLWRRWDKRGGTESASVARFVGTGAEEEVKKLQLRFNEQSRTPVWRRMVCGMLPEFTRSGEVKGGIPGREVWAGLQIPIMLIAGEDDKITPAAGVEKIAWFLGKKTRAEPGEKLEWGEAIVDAAAPVDSSVTNGSAGGDVKKTRNDSTHADIGEEPRMTDQNQIYEDRLAKNESSEHTAALKTTILPSPAGHALLYGPSTVRIIAGLIQTFFAAHIDPRLSLGWQLQYLTTEGKWDVKNLAKWQGVQAVSLPIPGSATTALNALPSWGLKQAGHSFQVPVFRAMKTLREVDDVHSPSVFVKNWQGKIKAVVDISHESPVYDPQSLEKGGIEYHKFPTVSKLPPTVDEVKAFVALIDRLRLQLNIGGPLDSPDSERVDFKGVEDAPVIGVHCHYGYNRTGFFLVCYLVERLGFRLQAAIDEFERQRPPGIRHGHFLDQLSVRYCVGLKRTPTL